MRIVHFAPFAPNACGLYEAARDMIVADRLAGYESNLIDVGIGGDSTQGEAGKVDSRGRDTIETVPPDAALDADVLIAHTGVPDPWFSFCEAPMVWMLHGRPQACFSPEQFGKFNSYSLISFLAKRPKVKAMVTFWPYHTQFWRVIIPNGKLFALDAPLIDGRRFSSKGYAHDFADLGGQHNVVLADSMREDIDLYEISHGAIEYAKNHRGTKFHFYGMEPSVGCWQMVFDHLKMFGALGEVWARRPSMEEIYRAADVVLSPHRIATRVIGEALCCGTPVIAAEGSEHATWTCRPNEPKSVAAAISQAVEEYDAKETRKKVKDMAESFSIANYNKSMEQVFQQIL